MQLALYYLLVVITLAFAFGVLINRNTIRSAMCLVGVMLSLAANFLLMRMEFVGIIQIVVYTGAIMVVFLFVIMLLNLRDPERSPWYLRNARFWGGALVIVFLFVFAWGVQAYLSVNPQIPGGIVNEQEYTASGTSEIIALATLMMTKYILPFILTSVLLLVAVIGAIAMARRYDDDGHEIVLDEEVA